MAIGESLMFVVLTLTICSGVVIAHRGTKKITTSYGGGLGVAIAYLAFLIGVSGGKYGYYLTIHMDTYLPATTPDQFGPVSYALLTNICYTLAFALPICLIADPTRLAARAISPITSLASMMVLLIIIPCNFSGAPHFTIEYIILGNLDKQTIISNDNFQAYSLFYSMHLINLLLAIGVGLTTPKYGGKGLISVGAGYGVVYLYIGIIVLITHSAGHNAGISFGDFSEGNFSIVGKIFGGNSQIAQIFFFSFVIVMLILGTLAQDGGFKRGWFKFGNAKSGVGGRYWDYNHYDDNTPQKDWGKLGKFLAY